MTLQLRPATPEDDPFLVQVHNIVVPDVPTTLEQLQRREKGRDPALVYHRFIAELGGQPVGQGFYSQQEWMFHPQKFALNVQVLPEFQRQGVGSALWARFEDELRPHDPIKLFASVREDRAASLKFLTKRGFTEEQRDRKSVLDLATARLDGLDAALEGIQAQGYSISTFADYDAPDKERRFYDFDAEVGPDAPRPDDEAFAMPSFERYWAPVHANPHFDPSLWFVAHKDGELVGLSQLNVNPAQPDALSTDFTATARQHRRQGLGTALKLCALTEAKRRGYRRVQTDNDSTNAPMIAINDHLGFVEQPVYLWMTRREGLQSSA